MLYGMEDYVYNEFGLAKKNKLNIKKIILIILVILACIFLIGFGIYSFSNKNDTETKVYSIEDNGQEAINTEEIAVKEENKEEIKVEENKSEPKKITVFAKNEKNSETYNGKHSQIPNHNIDNLKTKFIPVFNENGYNEVRDIYFQEEKQVYLTFDDGPSKDITPQILDILKEHDVKATFFVLGARVDLYPDILKRTFDEGHYIANHGYSHQYSKIYENKDTVFQEYVECENSIRNALNNQNYNSYLFRFPGGSSGGKYENIKAEAREHFKNYGVAFTNWNCLTGDAEGNETKEECIQEVIETKEGRSSIVLLMHDSNDKPQTVESLPDIIQMFKDEGYTFKTFYEIF